MKRNARRCQKRQHLAQMGAAAHEYRHAAAGVFGQRLLHAGHDLTRLGGTLIVGKRVADQPVAAARSHGLRRCKWHGTVRRIALLRKQRFEYAVTSFNQIAAGAEVGAQ